MNPAFTQGAAVALNGILADTSRVYAIDATIVSGQNLSTGAVLGKITASGKWTQSLSAAGDGSQTARAVLAEDCDASGGDKAAVVYLAGDFDETKLSFGTGHTAASLRESLADVGVFLHGATPA
jgi:hypothetical protein